MNKSVVHLFPIALLAMSLQANAQGASHETVDVVGQSSAGPVVSEDGATVIRTKNGISASLKMPTPLPGSYTYPDPNGFQPMVVPVRSVAGIRVARHGLRRPAAVETAQRITRVRSSPEGMEGLAAFLEKRKASFNGR